MGGRYCWNRCEHRKRKLALRSERKPEPDQLHPDLELRETKRGLRDGMIAQHLMADEKMRWTGPQGKGDFRRGTDIELGSWIVLLKVVLAWDPDRAMLSLLLLDSTTHTSPPFPPPSLQSPEKVIHVTTKTGLETQVLRFRLQHYPPGGDSAARSFSLHRQKLPALGSGALWLTATTLTNPTRVMTFTLAHSGSSPLPLCPL
jgi:hypothetical protein